LSLSIVGGSSEYDDDMPTEMARLLRLRDELGLNELVTFLGAQGQDVLPLYYAAADVVVMPSHYESFGMVALEAMACGTPVVASDVGGLSFTVADGVTGYLVPARDPAALAERICDILNDPVHRDELGQGAMRAAQQYGWERVADQIEALYDEVTS
jgi:D-inositol-3-phosphate glycosyltransferase